MPASESTLWHQKHFTVEEASKALPLVRLIVGDITRQFEVVSTLGERLKSISRRRRGADANDPYTEEVAQMEAEKEAEERKLLAFVEELSKLGVVLKGPDGLCDFPSFRDGREVYLCWRLGEPEIDHWHEIDAGFAGRKRLDED